MITDPFSSPPPPKVADRSDVDPFGLPSYSGRAIRTGDAEDRAEVPKNHHGQYLLPHQDGTKPANNKGHLRVSTRKAALSNTIGIQKWTGRRIVQAFAMDPRTVEQAIRAHQLPEGPERERAFGKIAEGAFVIGGGKERAGLGTEFHELAELKWRGELNSEGVDPKWSADLAALDEALVKYDIQVLPEYLERSVLCPYNMAGTFDNILRIWNPLTEEYELCVGDIKTGRTLDLGWLEILIQLWSYANAYALWTTTNVIRNDPKDPAKITDIEGFYEDMPRELRTDKAVILHVPLDGTASVYTIDLSGVERYVKAAVESARANREASSKVTLLGTVRPEAFKAPEPFATPEIIDPASVPQGHPLREVLDNPSPQVTVPRPVRPPATPDQLAQEAKAAERLAALDAATRNQRNDGDADDAQPTHDPVTGRKYRTCGHCHKPGHTQKNCPKNPASAKYVKPEPGGTPGDLVVPEPASMVISPEGPKPLKDSLNEEPFCLKQHPQPCQWTAEHPAAPGHWVCSITGKPAEHAWRNGTTALTDVPPSYGHPDPPQVPAPPAESAPEPPAAWAPPLEQPDPILIQIRACASGVDVLQLRHTSLAQGVWNMLSHESAGLARYKELTE